MLYAPEVGHMWDTSIVYYEGKYYLFSMFSYYGEECRHVWCAVSEDGVHFRDVGPVIRDQPVPVWKMFVHHFGDQFVMNHGSFSHKPGHGNDTLRFFTSGDLLNWSYAGEDTDMHPDERWYRTEERFDHMYTVRYNERYYGFVVATPLKSAGCGMMVSDDGLQWTALPPPTIEWGDIPPINFEVGGVEEIEGRYYLIGGATSHFGSAGYSVYTFVADSPISPFRPCLPRYRLCGSSKADEWPGVQWLASFGRGEGDEVLITNYITAGYSPTRCFIGLNTYVWLLPIKKAVIDAQGCLNMGYWPTNDRLKGDPITLLEDAFYELSTARDGEESGFRIGNAYAHRYLPISNAGEGIFLEGEVSVVSDGHMNPPRWGVLIGNQEEAMLLSLPATEERHGEAVLSRVCAEDFDRMIRLDVVTAQFAGRAHLVPGAWQRVKLLVRRGMFELYVDDLLVQSCTCADDAMIGWFILNGTARLRDIRAYKMTLS